MTEAELKEKVADIVCKACGDCNCPIELSNHCRDVASSSIHQLYLDAGYVQFKKEEASAYLDWIKTVCGDCLTCDDATCDLETNKKLVAKLKARLGVKE